MWSRYGPIRDQYKKSDHFLPENASDFFVKSFTILHVCVFQSKQMPSRIYHLNTATDTPFAAQLLVFLAEHAIDSSLLSFVDHRTLGGPSSSEPSKLDSCALMLGEGMHTILYKGVEFTVTVNPLVAGGKKLLTYDTCRDVIHGKVFV